MLFVFHPETAEDKLEIRIYDSEQDRCFHTAEDMLVVNMDDIAVRLDDFVGLSVEEKKGLKVHIEPNVNNDRVSDLIKKFIEVQ
jgi:hypothetical protein